MKNTTVKDKDFINNLYNFERTSAYSEIKSVYPESLWFEQMQNWLIQYPNSDTWVDSLEPKKIELINAFIKTNQDYEQGINIEPIDEYVKKVFFKSGYEEDEINEIFIRFSHDIRSLSLFARQYEVEKAFKDANLADLPINDDDFLFDSEDSIDEINIFNSSEIKTNNIKNDLNQIYESKVIDDLIASDILLDDLLTKEDDIVSSPIIDSIVTEEHFLELEENGFSFLGNIKPYHSNFVDGDLVFDSDVSSNKLWFKNIDGDLIINILGTDEEIVIEDWFSGNSTELNKILTGDGIELSHAEIEDFVAQMSKYDTPEDISNIPPTISLLWTI